ncbi:hypothetical protein RND81_13G098000 [Saponaria officinalis]|uniref:Uncharacterized protein n=1 Tax=Saponaria officinalis TaxID=3572 RepID=A0AAW1GY03_SAPOF
MILPAKHMTCIAGSRCLDVVVIVTGTTADFVEINVVGAPSSPSLFFLSPSLSLSRFFSVAGHRRQPPKINHKFTLSLTFVLVICPPLSLSIFTLNQSLYCSKMVVFKLYSMSIRCLRWLRSTHPWPVHSTTLDATFL